MTKLSKILIFVIIIFLIGVIISIEFIAPYAVLQPSRCKRSDKGITPKSQGLNYSVFNVITDDSIQLKGWFIYADPETAKGTVILLHGIASCKEHLLGAAKMLTSQNYNTILYDSRAHGESEGDYCTFGYFESRDVSNYIDHALIRFDSIEPIAVWGNSMGSAVALLAMETDKRIVCGIIESTYATLEELARDYMKRKAGIGFKFLSDKILKRAAEIANFQVIKVKPEESAKQVKQPILQIHGEKDKNVSFEYGLRIFNNLSSTHKEWYPIKNGDHDNLWKAGGETYKTKILEFLKMYMNP